MLSKLKTFLGTDSSVDFFMVAMKFNFIIDADLGGCKNDTTFKNSLDDITISVEVVIY